MSTTTPTSSCYKLRTPSSSCKLRLRCLAVLSDIAAYTISVQTWRLYPTRCRRDRRVQDPSQRPPCAYRLSQRTIHRQRLERPFYTRAVVPTQLRNLHVPIPPTALHSSQRVQEALPTAAAREARTERAEEYEASGCPSVRALRQHAALRTSAQRHTALPQPFQVGIRG